MAPTIKLKGDAATLLEIQLVRRTAQGDREAFEELYDRHSRRLYSLAFYMLEDREETQDALETVFLKIWREAASFDDTQGKPLSWLVSLMRNEALGRIRNRRSPDFIFPHLINEPVWTPIPEAFSGEGRLGGNEIGHIRNSARGLPVEQQRAIELAFFRGFTCQEIARQLGEPVEIIRARISGGMLRLRDTLAEAGLTD